MKITWRSLTVLAGFASGLGNSYAIDLFEPIHLPDEGFGSAANGFMDYTDDACMIVGQKHDFLGGSVPMSWDLDNDGQLLGSIALAIPPGTDGEARGAALLPTGEVVVVGSFNDKGSADTHVCVWLRSASGLWSGPFLSAPGFSSSRTMDARPIVVDGRVVYAGTVRNPAGVWRPVLFETGPSGTTLEILPTPPGQDGVAMSFTANPNPAACGWIESANGLMKPVAWDFGDGQWSVVPINVPNNASGVANHVVFDDGSGPFRIGTLSRNGRTWGFYTNSPGGGLLGLKPLANYGASSGETILMLGDTGAHEVGHLLGTSSNPGEAPEATMWIDSRPIGARQLLIDPTEVASLSNWNRGLDDDGLFASGQIAGNSSTGPPRAAAFRVTDNNVPSRAQLITGILYNGHAGMGANILWHDDGEELVIGTRPSGGNRTAELELVFNTVRKSIVADQWELLCSFRARAEGNHASSGTITTGVYCFAHQQFEPGGSFPVDGMESEMCMSLVEGQHSYHDPMSGAMRVRIRFVQNGNGQAALVMDLARVNFRRTTEVSML